MCFILFIYVQHLCFVLCANEMCKQLYTYALKHCGDFGLRWNKKTMCRNAIQMVKQFVQPFSTVLHVPLRMCIVHCTSFTSKSLYIRMNFVHSKIQIGWRNAKRMNIITMLWIITWFNITINNEHVPSFRNSRWLCRRVEDNYVWNRNYEWQFSNRSSRMLRQIVGFSSTSSWICPWKNALFCVSKAQNPFKHEVSFSDRLE